MLDPWPAIPAFGPRRIGPWTPCAACEATGGIAWTYHAAVRLPGERSRHVEVPLALTGGTWARYGTVPLCLEHARDVAASLPA